MSGFSLPQGAAPSQPKQISNRLLNMKFMQRAAASSNQNSPAMAKDEPTPKRRRTGDFQSTVSSIDSPTASSTATSTPVYVSRAAVPSSHHPDVNGHSVRRGINNFNAEGEETEWVLNVNLPFANGANADDEDEDEGSEEDDMWSPAAPRGRQTYGSFDRKKRKATEASTDAAATPSSTSKSSKKRGRPDEDDDEDLYSLPSNSDLDESSEGEIIEEPQPKKKKGKFDFQSTADLERMDTFDFQKGGVQHGLGRQRPGLGGGGGGGGGGGRGGGERGGHGPARGQRKNRKKVRKTM